MRLSNRDWIAWSTLAAIAVVVSAYYAQQQLNSSTTENVYRIVVTAERPSP
jgi:hypothetical protein